MPVKRMTSTTARLRELAVASLLDEAGTDEPHCP